MKTDISATPNNPTQEKPKSFVLSNLSKEYKESNRSFEKSACSRCSKSMWSYSVTGQLNSFCLLKHEPTYDSSKPNSYILTCDGQND